MESNDIFSPELDSAGGYHCPDCGYYAKGEFHACYVNPLSIDYSKSNQYGGNMFADSSLLDDIQIILSSVHETLKRIEIMLERVRTNTQ